MVFNSAWDDTSGNFISQWQPLSVMAASESPFLYGI